MNDKFKMVRYDINGEIKDGPLSIWEKILCIFIVLFIYPLIAEALRDGGE